MICLLGICELVGVCVRMCCLCLLVRFIELCLLILVFFGGFGWLIWIVFLNWFMVDFRSFVRGYLFEVFRNEFGDGVMMLVLVFKFEVVEIFVFMCCLVEVVWIFFVDSVWCCVIEELGVRLVVLGCLVEVMVFWSLVICSLSDWI